MFYRSGTSFDDIFEPRGTSTKRADVGYKIDSSDISNRYYSRALGGSNPATTYYSSGASDLSTLFAAKGSVSYGPYIENFENGFPVSGDISLTWQQLHGDWGGSASVTTAVKYSGTKSLIIDFEDDVFAGVRVTFPNQNAGTCTFWWKPFRLDDSRFEFRINGVQKYLSARNLATSTDWAQLSYSYSAGTNNYYDFLVSYGDSYAGGAYAIDYITWTA